MVEIYLCSIHFIIFLSCVYVGNYLEFYNNDDKDFYNLISLIPILNIFILIYSIYLIKKL